MSWQIISSRERNNNFSNGHKSNNSLKTNKITPHSNEYTPRMAYKMSRIRTLWRDIMNNSEYLLCQIICKRCLCFLRCLPVVFWWSILTKLPILFLKIGQLTFVWSKWFSHKILRCDWIFDWYQLFPWHVAMATKNKGQWIQFFKNISHFWWALEKWLIGVKHHIPGQSTNSKSEYFIRGKLLDLVTQKLKDEKKNSTFAK